MCSPLALIINLQQWISSNPECIHLLKFMLPHHYARSTSQSRWAFLVIRNLWSVNDVLYSAVWYSNGTKWYFHNSWTLMKSVVCNSYWPIFCPTLSMIMHNSQAKILLSVFQPKKWIQILMCRYSHRAPRGLTLWHSMQQKICAGLSRIHCDMILYRSRYS